MAKKGEKWSESERVSHRGTHRSWTKTLSLEEQAVVREKLSVNGKGRVKSAEEILSISTTLKKKYVDDNEFTCRMRKLNSSPEKAKKSSEAARKQWENNYEERRKACVEAARPPSVETRTKISEKLSGRVLPPRSLEHCRNLSISLSKPETKQRLASIASANRIKQAKPNNAELKLDQILQNLFPGRFILNVNSKVLFNKVPDFLDEQNKLIVELFGNYWHGSLITGHSIEVEEKQRVDYFAGYDYKTVIIWESELIDIELIKQKVLSKLTANLSRKIA